MRPLIWLLLGFLPDPADPLPPGEPTPHLVRTPAAQAQLSASPAARAFRDRWGSWWIRWDERDDTPRAALGGGVPYAERHRFAADLAALAGLPPEALVLTRERRDARGRSVHYAVQHNGALVEGAFLDLYAAGDQLSFALMSLHRPKPGPALGADLLGGAPRPGERWLAVPDGDRLIWRLGRVETDGDVVTWRARGGEEVLAYTRRMLLDLTAEERTVGDPLVVAPLPYVLVSDAEGSETTDGLGGHGRAAPLDVTMTGPWLEVYRLGALVKATGVADEQVDGGTDISYSAASVLRHFYTVHDWLSDRRPDHPWLPETVRATVDINTACCNAFYTNGTINFYIGGGGTNNLGRIADVIFHEYGHGVHDYILTGGTFAGDVSEGSADYVAATLLDDPILAPYARVDGGYIRELDTDRVYPTDVSGEVHNDGLIWGSFLWNLRNAWIDSYGEELGAERTDLLFLDALSVGPGLTDLAEAVIFADDDNGDLRDGTPNACELGALLDLHGLRGAPLASIVLEHTPLGDQASDAETYDVSFSLADPYQGCSLVNLGDVAVEYAVDPPAGAAVEDIAWTAIPAEGGPEALSARLPRAPAGAEVVYRLLWSDLSTGETASSDGGRASALYRFWVGDVEPVWCEGFEGGAPGWVASVGAPDRPHAGEPWVNQWEVAAPEGGGFNPDAAYEGTKVLGTAVTGEGRYLPNNVQQVTSPALDLTGASATTARLRFWRWLSVESYVYDQAALWRWEGGAPVLWWTSEAGVTGADAILDQGWTAVDLDVRDLAEVGETQLTWSLSADPGLEYGGWKLDSLCLYTLADAPRHYRAQDLSASDDGDEVTVRWSSPWVRPLYATALVRRRDAPPTSATDGELLELDLSPEPGEEKVFVDTSLLPGETAWYAVFAAEDAEGLLTEAVEGENLDQGGVPEDEPPPDTSPPEETPTDSGGDPAEVERPKEPRLSCAAGPAPGGLGLALAALSLWRRRRSR
ncbi:hypothetical protein L6R49_16400 [Myxococcota bacterium]|nr:hypothetical protein [Myxococcota bacterium]